MKRPSSISKKRITINHQTYSQCKRAEISDLLHKKQQKKLRPIVQFKMLKPNQHAGGGERVRTDDLLLAKQVLSQLSYAPVWMVGLGRLELPTSRLSGVRSNQAELQARINQT